METLASGISGAVVTALVHPLEVIKIALQVDNEVCISCAHVVTKTFFHVLNFGDPDSNGQIYQCVGCFSKYSSRGWNFRYS
jgi:hypothetical protein